MHLSAWIAVLLAVPVLLLGEVLARRVPILTRFNIPAPVIGGLLISILFLIGNASNFWPAQLEAQVSNRWWTWVVTTEPEWRTAPVKTVHLPFLVAFFTCIGLNASWALARKGSVQVIMFLVVASVLALLQNLLGVALAKILGVSPLLGIMCGSVTLTGGHGTALGFAADLQKAGLENAAVVGAAAATFGLVAGGLLGGPVAGSLIRRKQLTTAAPLQMHLEAGQASPSGILTDLRSLWHYGRPGLGHILLLLICIKIGAWVSFLIQQAGITFPVYIGAMLFGVLVRNVADLSGRRWIKTELIDTIASVALGIFLAIALMSLNLLELANAALPMLVILSAQVAVMALFARFVTFPAMGRDFDAAVMAGGHCGFGLGATSNAVATMKTLVENFGPAPRAFLVVPIVGAFLIDLINAFNITAFLNLFKS